MGVGLNPVTKLCPHAASETKAKQLQFSVYRKIFWDLRQDSSRREQRRKSETLLCDGHNPRETKNGTRSVFRFFTLNHDSPPPPPQSIYERNRTEVTTAVSDIQSFQFDSINSFNKPSTGNRCWRRQSVFQSTPSSVLWWVIPVIVRSPLHPFIRSRWKSRPTKAMVLQAWQYKE